jgi:hypothetical protein
VITNAGTAGGDVKALVYVDAFIPEVGETVFQIVASQRPITLGANTSPTETAAWKTLPSLAVVGTEDRVIPPATQRSMAERAGSTITEIAGSHVSMVSSTRPPTCGNASKINLSRKVGLGRNPLSGSLTVGDPVTGDAVTGDPVTCRWSKSPLGDGRRNDLVSTRQAVNPLRRRLRSTSHEGSGMEPAQGGKRPGQRALHA